QRFVGIMGEAREGCLMLLEQTDFNTITMGNAWTGMEMRAKELQRKVDDTWRDAVEPKFEEASAPREVIARERQKKDDFTDWLDVETERTRIAIYCDATRRLMEHTRTTATEGVRCSQCGATIEAPGGFRAVNVGCKHCGTVNTYEPGTKVRMIEAMGTHPLCEEHAWEAWLEMRRAERAWKSARPETIDSIRRYEHAQLAYWQTYLQFRARMQPELVPALDKDLRGKMAHFYISLEHNKAWVAAGKPRALA
ncbi:MAG: hypothetical protein JWM74_4792, partial [Myxococcaceae bacterium]|nr:hypothetical protein [Myxococcaceae bacterium]